ncbi:AraC-type DNA-binding protein [Chryseobacterium taichungense]|uniref:AraC-type DNA-binding protein n=2 Tax=Chryseobacterium taichungense TaxID=295069 RepID=A0A1H7X6Z0_9FLAO|nr:AraC-type DNA-binding protein [Chryseobacterium taichungense]
MLQLHHLEKVHPLKNDLLILPITEFFSRFDLQKHWRNRFYAIFLFKTGSGSLVIDDQLYELGKDRLFFLNYNQVFYFNPLSEPEGYAVLFTKSFYNHVYTGNKLIRSDTALAEMPQHIELSTSSKHEFWQNLYNIKKEYSKNRMFNREIICMQLKIFILRVIRASKLIKEHHLPADHKREVVEKFSELVNQFYKEYKTTAPYAAKLNLTPNYLNTLVKEQLALSAGRFIKNRVILEAERLLLHTTLSVTEISYELGFSDNSHFGKYFKAAHNRSPNSYRTQKSL